VQMLVRSERALIFPTSLHQEFYVCNHNHRPLTLSNPFRISSWQPAFERKIAYLQNNLLLVRFVLLLYSTGNCVNRNLDKNVITPSVKRKSTLLNADPLPITLNLH
jgi:hypothetical protein